MVISSAFFTTRTLIGTGLPMSTPSSSMKDSASYVPSGMVRVRARAAASDWSMMFRMAASTSSRP